MIPIRFQRGLELSEQGLWLDPWDDKPFAFVSHAHSDHIGNHREIILSKPTAQLMQARLPGKRNEHALEFGETARLAKLNDCEITLLPAGHIFGSAQFFLQNENGSSLLYTGDFKLRPSLSAEPTEWRHADTLIMETTFGLPKYRFPPAEQIIEQMVAFCAEALSEDAVPVLLGYSLGKSQEILCALVAAGLTPMLHSSVFRMTEIYRKLRPEFPCGYERYDANDVSGKVLICPPSANRSAMITKIKNRRVAMLTGWAIDPGARFRYQCDAAFPLSDHADYTDLIRYVELVQPQRVLTLHGFASQFARDLRHRGIEAWALTEQNQLEFSLSKPQSTQRPPRVNETSDAEIQNPSVSSVLSVASSEFAAFASLGEQICATMSKLKKIELLQNFFRSLAPDQLPIAAIYLTGRAFAQTDPRVLQVGWAVVKRALLAVSEATEQELRDISHLHADAGKTAFHILQNRTQPAPFSLADSRQFFESLQAARGPIAKGELLQKQLARISPLEAKYLVNIITGDLRIGLKEGLVEEAVAAAFDAPLAEIKEANMLAGDIGQVARLASQRQLDQIELRVFTPIKVMLASPEPTAEAIWKRLSENAAATEQTVSASSAKICCSEKSEESLVISEHAGLGTSAEQRNGERFFAVAQNDNLGEGKRGAGPANPVAWVEDKFDGIRAQLHRHGERAEIFTRDLKRVTEQFDEIAHAARGLRDDVIFDGEIVAFEQGRKLTFFDLQKRLGRKNSADLFSSESSSGAVPVRFMVFDLLWHGGKSLLKQPLHKRRMVLETLQLPPMFERVTVSSVHSAQEIDAAFDSARARGNEGLIIKDAQSIYTPGRRGLAWLKLKKELATLDVVVVGAELGHGKRNKVLSDYTFAVRDEKTGELLTIGKAYSGLTDAEIAQLTEHFTANTISQSGRFRQVVPNVVLEVAFDCVQPSERHTSGLALRFPRIKGIRTDKTAKEIDTLETARKLATGGSPPNSSSS